MFLSFFSFTNYSAYFSGNYFNHAVYLFFRIWNSGYMAPEYAMEGLFSVKSDVFSFGVIVLEIISGKRNSGFYLTGHAQTLLAYVSLM